MEHLCEFWDFFKNKKYEGGDFMFDLFKIIKNRMYQDKIMFNTYLEEGKKTYESIHVGKKVFFVGSSNMPMNTEFVIKNIEGEDCYAWCIGKKRLYKLPLSAFSENRINLSGDHSDIDPLGEEEWEDDSPFKRYTKNIFFEMYPYVIRVNNMEYVKFAYGIFESGDIDVNNRTTDGKKPIEKDFQFDKVLKDILRKYSRQFGEYTYTNHYFIDKENYRVIIEELRNKIEKP
jgi:hypothetical protein